MLVTGPMRVGASRLTSAGSRTLPAAIATPSIAVPRNAAQVVPVTRRRIPASRRTSAPASVRSIPIRRASGPASGDAPAKASTGSVVSSPTAALDRPRSARMSDTIGPTAVIDARRLIETSAMPATTRNDPDGAAVRVRPKDPTASAARDSPGESAAIVVERREELALTVLEQLGDRVVVREAREVVGLAVRAVARLVHVLLVEEEELGVLDRAVRLVEEDAGLGARQRDQLGDDLRQLVLASLLGPPPGRHHVCHCASCGFDVEHSMMPDNNL